MMFNAKFIILNANRYPAARCCLLRGVAHDGGTPRDEVDRWNVHREAVPGTYRIDCIGAVLHYKTNIFQLKIRIPEKS